MKALTLTQPWATLVALGAKQVETRSWGTRYRGPLAITAAKAMPAEARAVCSIEPAYSWLAAAGHTWSQQAGSSIAVNSLPRGCVVALCQLVDVRRVDGTGMVDGYAVDALERVLGDYGGGRYAWFLDDVLAVRTDPPVACRGSLGLWELPAATYLQALEQAALVQPPLARRPGVPV